MGEKEDRKANTGATADRGAITSIVLNVNRDRKPGAVLVEIGSVDREDLLCTDSIGVVGS